jgi:hypothetical protein
VNAAAGAGAPPKIDPRKYYDPSFLAEAAK